MSSLHQLDSRPLVALDWSARGVHVTFTGEDVAFFDSTDDFLNTLTTPHRICAEATFESWDTHRRAQILRDLRALGHELYVIRPLHTARHRGALPKSNVTDVRVIFSLASNSPLHFYPAPASDPHWPAIRDRANAEYGHLRRTGQKPVLAHRATEVLGPYRDRSPERQALLGNGRHYSPTLLAATWFAAHRAPNRATFERLLGLHGSAYPTLLRSEIHHHVFRHARRRGVAWTDFRRELRHLYQEFRHVPDPSLVLSRHNISRVAGTISPRERQQFPSRSTKRHERTV